MKTKVDPNNPLPLYYQVYQSLLDRIQSGEFADGSPLPPERKLVEEYGASRITIVKALDMLENDGVIDRQHGRGTFVSIKNEVSQAEQPRQSYGTIGMVVPSLSHPYLISVMSGIARQANLAGYALQVISSFENAAEERKQIENIAEQSLDGVILYPRFMESNQNFYRNLSEKKPLVMIDRYLHDLQADRVVFQDELAGFELTELLIKKGHRRIAWVSHEAPATSVQNRLIGHKHALNAHQIQVDEDLMWLDLFPRQKRVSETPLMSMELRQRLFQRISASEPTVLLAANYDIAQRLANCVLSKSFEYLHKSRNSLSLTERELDIAAFSYETSFAQPLYCLTYAYQSGEELGSKAAQLLFERIQQPHITPRSIEIPMQIFDSACDGTHPVILPALFQDESH